MKKTDDTAAPETPRDPVALLNAFLEREGIVRAIEPLLGERELRLVVQLVRESG